MGNTVSANEAPPQETDATPRASDRPSALVIVGPSGVGKGTLINKLKEGNDKFGFSCSHTTRKPREGEQVSIPQYYKATILPRTCSKQQRRLHISHSFSHLDHPYSSPPSLL
jgi:hypothetical protein